MSDLIDRKSAIEAFESEVANPVIADYCKEILDRLPSAQPERKKGRWIDDELICKARCSVCGEEWNWMDNDMERFLFCPSCGAEMEVQE